MILSFDILTNLVLLSLFTVIEIFRGVLLVIFDNGIQKMMVLVTQLYAEIFNQENFSCFITCKDTAGRWSGYLVRQLEIPDDIYKVSDCS